MPPAQLVMVTSAMANRSMPIRMAPVADDGDEGHADQDRRGVDVQFVAGPQFDEPQRGEGEADDHEACSRPWC